MVRSWFHHIPVQSWGYRLNVCYYTYYLKHVLHVAECEKFRTLERKCYWQEFCAIVETLVPS